MELILFLGVMFALIGLNGIFSLSEIAILSTKKAVLRRKSSKGDLQATKVLKLVDNPETLLSTVQVGITLIGILTGVFGGSAIADKVTSMLVEESISEEVASTISFTLVVVGITYFSLVFGELVPKRIALTNPEKISKKVVMFMSFFSRSTYPLVTFLTLSTNFFIRLLRIKKTVNDSATEEEIKALLHQGQEEGALLEMEKNVIERVFRVADSRIRDLMVPRVDVIWIDKHDSNLVIKKKLLAHDFSYFPVIEHSADSVVGIIRSKDILVPLLQDDNFSLMSFIKEPVFVGEAVLTFQVMEQFARENIAFAIVVNEYGTVEGIVSNNDISNSIVSQAKESTDIKESLSSYSQGHGESVLVDASLPIDDFIQAFQLEKISREERDGINTLGGLFTKLLGEMPQQGSEVTWRVMKMKIIKMKEKRISKVLVSKSSQS